MQREDRTNQAGEGRERGDRPRGFTLIELLVVILILGILVGLVVGVGRSVMIEMAKRRSMVIQDILLSAIRAYQEVWEAPPSSVTSVPLIINDSNFYGYIGWWSGITDAFRTANLAAKARNAMLYEQLAAEPASAKVLQKLPPEAVYTPTQPFLDAQGRYKVFRDGFDFDMDYVVTALGPLITSPGPDGRFSRDNVRDYDQDNIRSDGRGR